VVKGTVIKVSVSMGPEPDIKYMETLRGQKEEDARSFLIGQGMNPLSFSEYNDEYEEGRVIRTDPEAGQPLSDGQTVKIYVSKGPMVEMAKMPSLVGMSLRDALEQLDALGLTNYRFEYVDSEREKDEVINQSVTKFADVDVKTEIVLTVSKGPEETTRETTEPTTKPTETTEPTEEESTEPSTDNTTEPPTDDPGGVGGNGPATEDNGSANGGTSEPTQPENSGEPTEAEDPAESAGN
jgi:beta-lactam-binding protein with PASTA domain